MFAFVFEFCQSTHSSTCLDALVFDRLFHYLQSGDNAEDFGFSNIETTQFE